SRPMLSLRLIGVVESKSALTARIRHILSRPIPGTAKIGRKGILAIILAAAVILPMANGAVGNPEFTIKGKVVDATTGEPIPNVRVGDVENYNKGIFSALTDDKGEYSYKTWYEEHDIYARALGYENASELLTTKALGSESEKVIDFKLTKEADQAGSESVAAAGFKADLGDGITVELLGVCENPSIGKKWWKPDGSESDIVNVEVFGKNVLAPGKPYEFMSLVTGFTSDMDIQYNISDMTGYSYGRVRGRKDCQNVTAYIKQGKESVDISIGIASEPWQTVVTYSGNSGIGTFGKAGRTFTFGDKLMVDGKLRISVADCMLDLPRQLVAVSKKGQIIEGKAKGYVCNGDMRIGDFEFEGITPEDVKEFLFQTRYYKWAEFKNVSLKPGKKTGTEVSLSQDNAGYNSDDIIGKEDFTDADLLGKWEMIENEGGKPLAICGLEFLSTGNIVMSGTGADGTMQSDTQPYKIQGRKISFGPEDSPLVLVGYLEKGILVIKAPDYKITLKFKRVKSEVVNGGADITDVKGKGLDNLVDGFRTVIGTVYHADGSICKDATVGTLPMTDAFVYADERGKYKASWAADWEPNRIEIVMWARCLSENEASLTVVEKTKSKVDLKLAPAISVSGTVSDIQGKPIAGARVYLLGVWPGRWSCFLPTKYSETDENGKYVIQTVPAGQYYALSLGAKDYISIHRSGIKIEETNKDLVSDFNLLRISELEDEFSSPESTVYNFTMAAAKGDVEGVMKCFLPGGVDYDDTREVMTAEWGSSVYPAKVMLISIDGSDGIRFLSRKDTDGKVKLAWRVNFKNDFKIERRNFGDGSCYDFDATLVKNAQGKWLIDNF
ncbi:MAG: carboxypeptidase regulatory-like domain-containing protein, partial [Sedimentisphaerales bacterium]|nr:carboxypeptidase regulatory-like domain-containing protein [Sedimentisphaerales bacterium]